MLIRFLSNGPYAFLIRVLLEGTYGLFRRFYGFVDRSPFEGVYSGWSIRVSLKELVGC